MTLTYSIVPHETNQFCTVTFTNTEYNEVSGITHNITSEQSFLISYPANEEQGKHWTYIFDLMLIRNVLFEDEFSTSKFKTQMYVDHKGYIIVEIVTDIHNITFSPLKCKYRFGNDEDAHEEHMLFNDTFWMNLHNSSPFKARVIALKDYESRVTNNDIVE